MSNHISQDPIDHKWKIHKIGPHHNGDVISWRSDPNYDLYFQFPENLFDGNWQDTEVLKKGDPDLTKTVKNGAVKREYTYAIFIYDLKTYVETYSPPTIIIT